MVLARDTSNILIKSFQSLLKYKIGTKLAEIMRLKLIHVRVTVNVHSTTGRTFYTRVGCAYARLQ